jgi:hypothetical protein
MIYGSSYLDTTYVRIDSLPKEVEKTELNIF